MAKPKYSWRPNFKAGPESCRIQSFDEKRARLIAGGTFFRSKNVGKEWNSVNLTLIVSTLNLGGFSNSDPSTHPRWDVLWTVSTLVVELTVQHTFSNYIDYYYVEQGEIDSMNPPQCLTEAPGALRSQVNGDSGAIIEMPTNDVQAPWNASVDEQDVCLLSTFSGTLSGGDSGPLGASGIRTGPEKAIIFVNQSEQGIPNGALQTVQQIREYNGYTWIPFTGN